MKEVMMEKEYAEFVLRLMNTIEENSDIQNYQSRWRRLRELLVEQAVQQSMHSDGFTDFEASGKCSNCGNEISITVSSSSRR